MFKGLKTFQKKLTSGLLAGLVGLTGTSTGLVHAFGDDGPFLPWDPAPPEEHMLILGWRTPFITGALNNKFGESSMPEQLMLNSLREQRMQQQQLCDVVSAQIDSAEGSCMNETRDIGQEWIKSACQVQQGQSATYTRNSGLDIEAGFNAEYGPVSGNVGAKKREDGTVTFTTNWNTQSEKCLDAARQYVTWGLDSCKTSGTRVQSISDSVTGCTDE